MNEQITTDHQVETTTTGLMAIKSANNTFNYSDRGHGTPVLMVHCSGSSNRQWSRYANALQDRYRVLALDLHGHGETPSPDPIQSTFNHDVEIVKTLAEAVDGPLHMVGHSYGGFVALHAAMALQDRLLSLTLIEPAAFHLLRQDSEMEAWSEINKVACRQMTQVDQGDLEGSAAEFMAYWTGSSVEEARSERNFKYIASTMPSVASIWDSLFRQPYTLNDYSHFPFPTLLVRGTKTSVAADRVIRLLDQAIANNSLVDIPGAGHMSPVTHPEAVIAALHHHLDRNSAPLATREGIVSTDSFLAVA